MYDVRINHGIYYEAILCSVVWSKTKLVHTPSTGGFHKFLNTSRNYTEEEFCNTVKDNVSPIVIRVHDIILLCIGTINPSRHISEYLPDLNTILKKCTRGPCNSSYPDFRAPFDISSM